MPAVERQLAKLDANDRRLESGAARCRDDDPEKHARVEADVYAYSHLEPPPVTSQHKKMHREISLGGTDKVAIDETRWPILVVTQRAEQLTDGERLASLEASNKVLSAHGTDRYAMVLDNRKAGPMPPTQRKLMADYMEKHAMRARSRCACTAFVSDSIVLRGVLTAIMWLRKPDVETQVFGDLDEAIAWARSKLGLTGHQETSRP